MKKNSISKIFLIWFFLTECTTTNVPPIDTYTLSPELDKNPALAFKEQQGRFILKLSPIKAARELNTTDILYSSAQYNQESYAYSRWSDAPVTLLQMLFLSALEETGQFRAVVPSTSASKPDFLLESILFNFSHHINTDGTSYGFIRIRFYLIDYPARMVTATREFSSRVTASSQNAESAAVALNKAAENIALDLTTWLTQAERLKK